MAVGIALLGVCLIYRHSSLAVLGPLRNLAAMLFCSLPYALLVAWCPHIEGLSERRWLLLAGSLALRCCFPGGLLSGSDDAFRYLWDGRVQSAGINPYAYAPQAAELAHLRDATFWPNIFRPDLPTVYPPLAQLWFLLAYWLSPNSVFGLKLVLGLHDLVSVLILAQLLRRAGRPESGALVYAWSPLVLVQSFAGCHLDALLVPWLLLAIRFADRRPVLAGASLAASAMVRPITLLCIPSLLWGRTLRYVVVAVAAGFGVGLSTAAPYLSAGAGMFTSLGVYARHWRFNGSLFRLLEAVFGGLRHFRPVLYGVVAAGSLAVARLPARLPVRFALALALYLALAPTVYPWYLIPVVALGAFFPSPLIVLLPAFVSLSDLVFVDGVAGGQWSVPQTALLVEYCGIYGVALWELSRRIRPCRHR